MALAVASTLGGLLLLEAGFRLFYTPRIKRPRVAVYQGVRSDWCCGPEGRQPDGLWGYTPSTEFQHCYDGDEHGHLDADHCVAYRINSWGYRDVEHALEKPAGTYRILILGDSFAVGEGVPIEQTFTGRLVAACAARTAGGNTIEIVNLATPGAHTGTEIRRYQLYGRRLAPDFVVVQWNTNDFRVPALYRQHQRLIGSQYQRLLAEADGRRWGALAHFVGIRLALSRLSNDLTEVTDADLAAGQKHFDELAQLRDEVVSDHAGFAVLVFPELIRFSRYPYRKLVDALNVFGAERGLPIVDLLPELSKYRDRDLWVHETDHHPNPIAHAIAADAVERHLAATIPLDPQNNANQ